MHYRLLAHVFARKDFNSLGFVLNSAFYPTRSYYDFSESDNCRRELHIDSGIRFRRDLNQERVRCESESTNDDCLGAGGKPERCTSS
jgi:hypothetical protein